MPMSFPTMKSLSDRASQRGFRQPKEGEPVSEYRVAFADYMRAVDCVESAEIRSGLGWDQQDPRQLLEGVLGPERMSILDQHMVRVLGRGNASNTAPDDKDNALFQDDTLFNTDGTLKDDSEYENRSAGDE